MDETTLLRAHVERVLEDAWDVHRAEKDQDGDYPFRWGTAACWVRVEPGTPEGMPPAVSVFAHAAKDLKQSAKLLAEVNELNLRSRWAKVGFDGGAVIVSRTLDVAGSERDSLMNACDAVGRVADDIGSLFAGVYGGVTPFPPQTESADER